MTFTERPAGAWSQTKTRAISPSRLEPGRALAVTVALLMILCLSPLLIAVALTLWLEGGGPVIFAQRRVGRGGRRFACYKFRSMSADAETALDALLTTDPQARAEWTAHRKLRRDPRITSVGRWLRRSSLDELPQLFNVVNGDMSFVGPRPMLECEQARYGRAFADYASVRPGITGLWQVSGRSALSHHRRVALDIAYVRRKSLALDCRILLATIPAVLSSRGAS